MVLFCKYIQSKQILFYRVSPLNETEYLVVSKEHFLILLLRSNKLVGYLYRIFISRLEITREYR